ncbi:DNA-binding transcriptional regulator, PadR family [Enhydrobacter aerosaccus]|uniref:DNA-binding transcriptional regulator, PadR family n=1 Tax=Enhydrobacter aerosaccus TaxID=225324 RepID=A0A1T4K9E5_9HYPH|nr:PadR family transcriptional regulator [Enhydrobacter aerosaccus]SJZ38933.1 DNA-binding transcriptional regulator, PadR family [Enhydrobacter aerosaccus]
MRHSHHYGHHRFQSPQGEGRFGDKIGRLAARFGRHGFGHHGRGPWGEEADEGRGGRRRRVFDSGELRLVLLKLIADQPRHGYELIRAIEELTGGAYVPSPGVIYPTLTMLQEMGQIAEADAEGARKPFAVTPEGTAHLAEKKEEVEALFARLAELASIRERTDVASVRRAMRNLKTALLYRLERGDVKAETQHDIAAILDEAARKIERL